MPKTSNSTSLPLGQRSTYIDTYDASLLYPIERLQARDALGIGASLPFHGYDTWTAFELSWLNPKGKPIVALADVVVDCRSDAIIESKSFKLYLNSFNQTSFESPVQVRETLIRDLSQAVGMAVEVSLSFETDAQVYQLAGDCIDVLDVECTQYHVNPALLRCDTTHVQHHCLYSHLLKSNCLVTGQPDWGSLQVTYSGPRIDSAALLHYVVSYRHHNEFHEQCVERIFMDIKARCEPDELTVYARYTRRGGLDINPIRSTLASTPPMNRRLFRQ